MNPVIAILVWLVRFAGDWVLLAARVRTILTNDLPHLQEQQTKTHALVLDQIGFCRGRLSATGGNCEQEETEETEKEKVQAPSSVPSVPSC